MSSVVSYFLISFFPTAIVAGWGNLGAGMTNLMVGSILFPIFTSIYDGDTEMAWRTVCVVPAIVTFATGVVV